MHYVARDNRAAPPARYALCPRCISSYAPETLREAYATYYSCPVCHTVFGVADDSRAPRPEDRQIW